MRPGRYLWIPVCVSIGLLTSCGGARRSGLTEPRQLDLLPREGRGADRTSLLLESSFAQAQLRHSRVRAARRTAHGRIVAMYDDRNIPYPAAEVYLRVFKQPGVLEVWVRPDGQSEYRLLKSYPICAQSGVRGPKRWRGDQQVPEGFYYIDRFNGTSNYHLSLGIDYPNRHDRAANVRGRDLGGDIFIHGGCESEGCLAVTDQAIEELYWIAVEARAVGQQRIPVHIFPARLDNSEMRQLDVAHANHPLLMDFWKSLKPGYDYFEQQRRVPQVGLDARGRYSLETGGQRTRHLASSRRTEPNARPAGKKANTSEQRSGRPGTAQADRVGSAPHAP